LPAGISAARAAREFKKRLIFTWLYPPFSITYTMRAFVSMPKLPNTAICWSFVISGVVVN